MGNVVETMTSIYGLATNVDCSISLERMQPSSRWLMWQRFFFHLQANVSFHSNKKNPMKKCLPKSKVCQLWIKPIDFSNKRTESGVKTRTCSWCCYSIFHAPINILNFHTISTFMQIQFQSEQMFTPSQCEGINNISLHHLIRLKMKGKINESASLCEWVWLSIQNINIRIANKPTHTNYVINIVLLLIKSILI